MQELVDIARSASQWSERAIEDIEKELLQASRCLSLSGKMAFHIRYRIDLYNYYNWIYQLGPEALILVYNPINLEDTLQHKYVLLSLLQLSKKGFRIVLSYHASSHDLSIDADELVTSTLDTYFMRYLQCNRKVSFSSATRFIYSVGKSKASLEAITSEYNYQKISYAREGDIKGLSRGPLPLEKIPATKYDTNIRLFSTGAANWCTIGWFPSIKDCSVINLSLIKVLMSILRERSNVRLVVGVHPHLSLRSPQKYKLIHSLASHNDENRLLYTELIDSAILLEQTDIVIGDVGSTLWDARNSGKALLLLRDTDSTTFEERLLKNHCYWEWYYGTKSGRLNSADCKTRLMEMSELAPHGIYYV